MDAAAMRPWLARYGAGVPHELMPRHRDVLSGFRAQVGRRRDGDCLRYAGAVLSFGAVDELSDALAVAFARRGVVAGDRVAVMLQNVPTSPITMLAAWKLGAVVVPVNPMYRPTELGHVLDDSGARSLVTSPELLAATVGEALEDRTVELVVTDPRDLAGDEPPVMLDHGGTAGTGDATRWLDLVGACRGERPAALTPAPEDPALLSYTSGTTGPPKGAINTHANVAFSAEVYRTWIDLGPDDVCLGIAPLFHITGAVGHLAVSVMTGMPLVLSYRFDAAETLQLIERHRCTFTVGAITAFIALMNADGAGQADLRSLTKVYSGGAPIPPSTVEAFEQTFGAYIHPIYGMTETTSPSHAVPFAQRAPVDPRSGALSIGVPVPDTDCRIVGDDGTELAAGEIGELVTSGPQVVPGYWRKPEETAAAIGPDGIRTGDVGFRDEDGWFFLVDRKKDMIIASGYKVWPREVEDVLYEHPAVREAAVVGVPDDYRGESVAAYVSLRPDTDVGTDELIALCRDRLAAYKVPRSVEILDELPKTATGKILRRALR